FLLSQHYAELLQICDQLLTLLRMKIVVDMPSALGADPFHLCEPIDRRRCQRVHRTEFLSQFVGHAVRYHSDSKPGEQPCQAALFAGRNLLEQFLRSLLSHALQAFELLRGHSVQVGEILDESLLNQLVDELLAEPANVHGSPPSELQELPLDLSAALVAGGGADVAGAARFARAWCPTHWAGRRETKRLLLAGARLLLNANGLRDALPLLSDSDHIAELNVLLGDVVGVVQGGATNSGAG